jgi:hypothetical protein
MTNVEGLCTILGTAVGRFNDAADGESRNGFVVPETSPNQGTAVRIKTAPNAANYSALYWNATTTGVTNNITNTVFSLQFSASIAEWAGSGTVQLAQNDVEYAYNTSTSTTSDTTSFGYGPTGVSFTAMAPTGTNTIEKRVRFQTPIQTTDRLVLEIFNGVNWTAAEQSIGGYTTNDTATVSYGQLIRPTVGSSTDVSVLFASATAGQSTWATTASYGFKWRVRKSSAGAAVGFGLAAQAQSGLISQEVSGTFTGTLTGVSTTVTGTCRYTVVGKMVTLFLPDMTGTSNTTVQCTITGLPAVITPQRGQWVMGTFTDNGAQGLALHEVSTAGTVKANRFTAINSITGGTTGSGTKGFATQTLTYSLD